jgi:hypothetical protein
VIISEHMTRVIAYARKFYYERLQASAGTGNERARARLAALGVPLEAQLVVVHEPHRRLKWSVKALV